MKNSKLRIVMYVFYCVIIVAYAALFAHIDGGERITVRHTDALEGFRHVTEYQTEIIPNADAPLGYSRVFSWTLPEDTLCNSVLAFYQLHHETDIYLDDELVYSMRADDGNRFTRTTACSWIVHSFRHEDAGKRIRVVMSPIYESVGKRVFDFMVGSPGQIYLAQLEHDFFMLLLSGMCVVVGLLIMAVQAALILRKSANRWSIFFMGNITAWIGLWKFCDTRFVTILFAEHTLLMSYLSIGSLFLGTLCAALFLCEHIRPLHTRAATAVAMAAIVFTLFALVMQLTGAADFREVLPLGHVLIVLIALALVISIVQLHRMGASSVRRREWLLSGLLAIGVSIDLALYNLSGSSDKLSFSLLSMLLYTMLIFMSNLTDANKRAYTDTLTGLFNKNRWDTLMNTPAFTDRNIGVIMFDLNRLKHVNDTMGHAAGDRMIFNFANILRNSIPISNTICRWGGDEFTVLCMEASQDMMEMYIDRVHAAANDYNASGQTPSLHFAAGYALSSEFPELSPSELLRKADERMYLDKNQWYQQHTLTRS